MCEKVNAIINASAEDKKKFLTKVARLVDPNNKQFSEEEKRLINKKAAEVWMEDAEHVIDIMQARCHLTSETADNFHDDVIKTIDIILLICKISVCIRIMNT